MLNMSPIYVRFFLSYVRNNMLGLIYVYSVA